MNPITKSELDESERIAGEATKGPWDYYLEQGYEGNGVVITYSEDEDGMRSIGGSVFKRLVTSEENKTFIAHHNPDFIKRLISSYREAIGVIEGIIDDGFNREITCKRARDFLKGIENK